MLLVWLPLNGNLDNLGHSTLTLTSGTAQYKNGKFGTGLDLSSRLMFSCPDLIGLKKFTISFWVVIEDNESITTNWQDIFGIYEQKADGSSYGQFRAETYYNPKTNAYLGVHWHDNTNYGITTGSLPTHYTGDRGVWHHCAIAVDSDNFIRSYTDGVLKNEYTTGLAGGHIYTGVFWLGETNNIAGCVNDVRIYDHIVSSSEIKSISQGKVLHYPLSREGIGNDNLLKYQISSNYWTNWQSSSAVLEGSTREKIVFDGKTWAHINQKQTGYMGYAIDPAYNQIPIDTSKTYVWSCLAKAGTSAGAKLRMWCHWRSTEGGVNLSQSITDITLTETPQRVSWVLPKYTNTTYTVNRINLMLGSATINNEVYYTDVKIEEGNVATTWIPHTTDAEYEKYSINNTVHDISGYGHNGTQIGTFSWSSDTPRYNMSAVFNGTDSCIQFPFNDICTNGDIFTMNIWWKKTELGSKSYETLIGGPSGFEMDTRAGSATTLSLYMASIRGGNVRGFNMNEWYMITLVNDGTNELYYVNGVLVKTIEKKNMPSGNYYIGAWQTESKQNFCGNMSDFRFYKTALFATDIKDLYNKHNSTITS